MIPVIRQYKIQIVDARSNELFETIYSEGTSFYEALELAIDGGKINLPQGFGGHAITLLPFNIALRIEIGTYS